MKMSAQSLAVRRRDRALFPCPEWRKQYEETNHHCCNIRSLSGPVCGYVATELTSRGNNRTAHASRCNRHTARSSGDSRDGRSHTARGRKGRSWSRKRTLSRSHRLLKCPHRVKYRFYLNRMSHPHKNQNLPRHLTANRTTWSMCRTSAG